MADVEAAAVELVVLVLVAIAVVVTAAATLEGLTDTGDEDVVVGVSMLIQRCSSVTGVMERRRTFCCARETLKNSLLTTGCPPAGISIYLIWLGNQF